MKYQKPWRNTQKVTDKEKRSKRLNEVRPFENINKNPHSLLDISPEQKKVSPSHKVQDHVQEEQNPFGSKEDNPTQKLQESVESSKLDSHKQECQEKVIQGKINMQRNSKLEYW